MDRILSSLYSNKFFEYFEEISAIPRGSSNCKGISDYCVNFAMAHNLEYVRDDNCNVLIRKPANCKNAKVKREPVILQGHMDMVCERDYESASKHDFYKDGICLALIDDFIYAKGTTLGADDGIALAYALAVLDDNESDYPDIEAVFTTDEEIGMKGALTFDTGLLKGKRMINLDHERDGEILTCSAGGRRVTISYDCNKELKSGVIYKLTVCGLVGGHSGMEIDKGRANGILLLGKMLNYLSKKIAFDIVEINGGLMDSAIPREANAQILLDEKDAAGIDDIVDDFFKDSKSEYDIVEPDLMIYAENYGKDEVKVVSQECKDRLLLLLDIIPDGVIRMNSHTKGLVETSLNSGIINVDNRTATLTVNIRSLREFSKEALSDKLEHLANYTNGSFRIEFDYPAWQYEEDSTLREITFDVYQRLFMRNPNMIGFHAGLECGIFYKNIPGIDIVAFGPEIKDIHTTKERMSVSSAIKNYELLTGILKEC